MMRSILILVLGLLISLMPVLGQPSMAAEGGCHHVPASGSMQVECDCDTHSQHEPAPCGMMGTCGAMSCVSFIANSTIEDLMLPLASGGFTEMPAVALHEHVIRPPIEPPRRLA